MTVSKDLDDGRALIAAWETNNRVTMFLVENLPLELWFMNVPRYPRRTVGTFAALALVLAAAVVLSLLWSARATELAAAFTRLRALPLRY